jgi:hypothetical protein
MCAEIGLSISRCVFGRFPNKIINVQPCSIANPHLSLTNISNYINMSLRSTSLTHIQDNEFNASELQGDIKMSLAGPCFLHFSFNVINHLQPQP